MSITHDTPLCLYPPAIYPLFKTLRVVDMLAIEDCYLLLFLKIAHTNDAGILLKIEIPGLVVHQMNILLYN